MEKIIFLLALFLPIMALANIDPPELETFEQIYLEADISATKTVIIDAPTTQNSYESEVCVMHFQKESSLLYNILKKEAKEIEYIEKVVVKVPEFDYSFNKFLMCGLNENNQYNFKQYPKYNFDNTFNKWH